MRAVDRLAVPGRPAESYATRPDHAARLAAHAERVARRESVVTETPDGLRLKVLQAGPVFIQRGDEQLTLWPDGRG